MQERHCLTNLDEPNRIATCSVCGPIRVKMRVPSRVGVGRWKCATKANMNKRIYKKHRKEVCEACGFVPVNICQLDVDHIDNNHSNNDISNLQTLCANCHRLKTYLAIMDAM